MTRQECPDCPNIERRHAERRQSVAQSFAFCAKFVGIVTVATAAVSIGAGVSISTAITRRADMEHQYEMQALRDWSRDMEQRILKLEAR